MRFTKKKRNTSSRLDFAHTIDLSHSHAHATLIGILLARIAALGCWNLPISNMAATQLLLRAQRIMIHKLEPKSNESEREHESTQPFAKLVPKQSREAQPMMEIIFKTFFWIKGELTTPYLIAEGANLCFCQLIAFI